MLKKNQKLIKKSDLTRVESLALCIAQWCILELLPQQLKSRHVFFTQISVKTVPADKFKEAYKLPESENYKAIMLKAYFTTLDEFNPHGADGYPPKRPYAEATMLFRDEGAACHIWKPEVFKVKVYDYDDIYHDSAEIFYLSAKHHQFDSTDYSQTVLRDRVERLRDCYERFEKFFKKLSFGAPWGDAVIFDVKTKPQDHEEREA